MRALYTDACMTVDFLPASHKIHSSLKFKGWLEKAINLVSRFKVTVT
jgi:hypothetical protein